MIILQERYKQEVIPAMMKRFNYKNKHQVPKIEKVVINIGFGREAVSKDGEELKKFIQGVTESLALITGQKLSLRKSKQSIAGFKLREGINIGAKATLRGKRMFDFLVRLIDIALPRSRDFRGLDIKSFDQKGNFCIGLKEHIIFPEVLVEKAKNIFGFQVVVKTTAETKEEGIELLRYLRFPIKKD